MEVIGGVSGVIAIIGGVAKLAKSLNEVRESYKSVALNIQLAAIQLSTIRDALEAIAEWRLNSHGETQASRNLDATLAESLKGCAVLITVIDSKLGEAGYTPGVKQKIRHLWLEDVLKVYLSNLDGQVRALQLLLTSFQCRTVTEQIQRLERAEARSVFEQVRADTASLTVGNKDLDATSVLSFDPSVNLEVDSIILKHPAYQAVYGDRYPSKPERRPRLPKRPSEIQSPQSSTELKLNDQETHNSAPDVVIKLLSRDGGTLEGALRRKEDSSKTVNETLVATQEASATQLQQQTLSSQPEPTADSRMTSSAPVRDGIQDPSLASAVAAFKDQLQSAFDEPLSKSAQTAQNVPNVEVYQPESDDGHDFDEMITMLPMASHFDISRKSEDRRKLPIRRSVDYGTDRPHRITAQEPPIPTNNESSTLTEASTEPFVPREYISTNSDSLKKAPSSATVDIPLQEDNSTTPKRALLDTREASTLPFTVVNDGERQGAPSSTRPPSTDSDLYTSSLTEQNVGLPMQLIDNDTDAQVKDPQLQVNDDTVQESTNSQQNNGATETSGHARTDHKYHPNIPPSAQAAQVNSEIDAVKIESANGGSDCTRKTLPVLKLPAQSDSEAAENNTTTLPISAKLSPAAGSWPEQRVSSEGQESSGQDSRPRSATEQPSSGPSVKKLKSARSLRRSDLVSSDFVRYSNGKEHGLKIILTPETQMEPKTRSEVNEMTPPTREPPPPPPAPPAAASSFSTLSPTNSIGLRHKPSVDTSSSTNMMTGALTLSPVEREASIDDASTISSSDPSDRQTLSSGMTSASNTIATSYSTHPQDSLRGQAQTELHKLKLEIAAAKTRGDTSTQKASLQRSMDIIQKTYLNGSGSRATPEPDTTQSPPKSKIIPTSLVHMKSFTRLSSVNRRSRVADLHEAVRVGNVDSLRALLEDRVNVNARGDRLKTPQMEAAMHSHLHCLEILKEYGADEFAVDGQGRTALHMAVMANQPRAVTWLLQAYPPLTPDIPRRKASRLAWATEAMTGARSTKVLREVSDGEGSKPVHVAAKLSLSEMLKLLLDNGADIDSRDNWGRTPLIDVAILNRKTAAEVLIQRGADLSATDVREMTPLHWAAKNNHLELISLLLTKGAARFGHDKNGDLPVHLAAREGHIKAIEILGPGRAGSNIQTKHGETLTHIAALANQLELAKYLFSNNVDVNPWARPQSYHLELGSNVHSQAPKLLPLAHPIIPLHYSCTKGYYEMTELLLENGAWVNAAPDDGRSPLMMAVESGDTNLVCLLLARGAKVNAAVPGTCLTALHISCRRGDLETTQELIRYGAKATARTQDLRTPEEYVSKCKDPKKRAALEAYFAELSRQRLAKIKAQMTENRQIQGAVHDFGQRPHQPAQPQIQQGTQWQPVPSTYVTEYVDEENDTFPDAPPQYYAGSNVPRNLASRAPVNRAQQS